MNKELIINKLTNKNDKTAYDYAKKIAAESEKSDKYLEMIPMFTDLLIDESSYIRTRAFILICSQSRWANNKQIEKVFKQMEPLLNDPKPTVVRQCLKALQEVVVFRPEMSSTVKKAISKIDLKQYKDSMSPLIKKDIDELKELLNDH